MEKEKFLEVGYIETENKQENDGHKLDTLFKYFNDNVIFVAQTKQDGELVGMVLFTKEQIKEIYNSIYK